MRHLISLGRNCDVAFQLRMHGQENVPHFFDWLGTPASALSKVFAADFDVFHADDLVFRTDNSTHYVEDAATGIVFFHQFPMLSGHVTSDFMLFYAHFIKNFKFQARRFREYVQTLPCTLVRRDITEPEAIALEEVFFARYPGADVQFLYLVHDQNEFVTSNGHARHIPRTASSLGNPDVWIKLLTEEGLIGQPYRHATVEILGASHDDHSLSPDDRFNEDELRAAIEGNPDHWMFSHELARYYRKRKRFDLAEIEALRALAKVPSKAEALYELIFARWKGGKLTAAEAAVEFIEISKKSRLPMVTQEAAAALFDARQFEEAAAWSAKAISQNPLDHHAFYTRAMALYALKDVARAERAMAGAARLWGRAEVYHHMHARFLDELGRFDEAIEAEHRCLNTGGSFEPLVHLGGLMEKLGRYDEALAFWRRALPSAGRNEATVRGWIDRVTAQHIPQSVA
jgi:Tfp pilus assembly protein PilF